MTKPTTEELKDLLGKVTQGEWHFGKDCEAGLCSGFFVAGGGAVLADLRSDNQINDATLIALAPMLAAEVVELRSIIERIVSEYYTEDNGRSLRWEVDIARQALSQK